MQRETLIAGVLALLLLGIVVATSNPLPSTIPAPTATSSQLFSTSTQAVVTQKSPSSLQTYTNTVFHYSFSYPSSWIAEPEESIIDADNQIPSMVSVHEPKEISPRRFSVTINRNERTLKSEAPKTESVTIAGVSATAYIFPEGYKCTPQDDPDCSFFLIPILHKGVWYEITAANDAKMLGAYRDILASFRFTD